MWCSPTASNGTAATRYDTLFSPTDDALQPLLTPHVRVPPNTRRQSTLSPRWGGARWANV